jgi:hypothetical protein
MDRNKIYEEYGIRISDVETARKDVRTLKPIELELLGANNVDGLLTNIEALAVRDRAEMISRKKPDDNFGTVNSTIKFVEYIRKQLNLPE